MPEHNLNNTTPRISDERIIELALTDEGCSEKFITLLLFAVQTAIEANSSNQFSGVIMATKEVFNKQLRYAIADTDSQDIATSNTDGTITICEALPNSAALKLHNIRIAKSKYGNSLHELREESKQTHTKLDILFELCRNANRSIEQNLQSLQINSENPHKISLKTLKNKMQKNKSPINLKIFEELQQSIIRRDAIENEYKDYAKKAKQQSKEISKIESFLAKQPSSNLEKLDLALKNMFTLANMPCQASEKGPTYQIQELLQSSLISSANKQDLNKLMATIVKRDQALSKSKQTQDKEAAPKILDLPSLYQQLDDIKQNIETLKKQQEEIQLQIDNHNKKPEKAKSKNNMLKKVHSTLRQCVTKEKPKTAETDLATAEKQGKEIDESLTASTQKRQHLEQMITVIIQEIVVHQSLPKTMMQQIGSMFSNLCSFIKSCFIPPDYEQLNNETQQESVITDNTHPTESISLNHEEEQMEQPAATTAKTIEPEDKDTDGEGKGGIQMTE